MRRVRDRFSAGLRIAALFSAGFFLPAGVAFSLPTEEDPVAVAYVPTWGLDQVVAMDLRGSGLTHLVYAFVKPVYDPETGDVKLLLDFPNDGIGASQSGSEVLATFLAVARESGLRKLVSMGGWGSSEYFSDIAADESSRRLFAERVRAFVLEHGFDGVDLDWEYPLHGGAEGTDSRAEDPGNLVKLAQAVRRAFDRHPDAGDKKITVAVPGSYGPLSTRYRLRPLSKHVDWFHVMAYDFAGAWSQRVAHNAPLFAPGDPEYLSPSVAGAVAALGALGVPREKTVLGLSLAGVRFEGVRLDGENAAGASFESVDEETASEGWNDYRFLVPRVFYPVDVPDWTVVEDAESGADWMVSMATGTVISFESERAAVEKARFAAEQGLRGLMFWSLDKDGAELPLIRNTIKAFKR